MPLSSLRFCESRLRKPRCRAYRKVHAACAISLFTIKRHVDVGVAQQIVVVLFGHHTCHDGVDFEIAHTVAKVDPNDVADISAHHLARFVVKIDQGAVLQKDVGLGCDKRPKG